MKKESKVVIVEKGLSHIISRLTNLESFKNVLSDKNKEDLKIKLENQKISVQISGYSLLIGNHSWEGVIKDTIQKDDYGEIQYYINGSGLNSGTIWIQLLPINESSTKLRLVFDLDINLFSSIGLILKAASSDQIQEIVDRAAYEIRNNL